MVIGATDIASQNLIHTFEVASKFIDEVINNNGNILVHWYFLSRPILNHLVPLVSHVLLQ